MTAYATIADLVTRYGETECVQLSDQAIPPSGVIDQAVLAAALDDATGVIDGLIARAGLLPSMTPPPLLTAICCDLARERLYRHAAPESVTLAADRARALLQSIAEGTVVVVPPAESWAEPRSTGPSRVFTAETTEGY